MAGANLYIYLIKIDYNNYNWNAKQQQKIIWINETFIFYDKYLFLFLFIWFYCLEDLHCMLFSAF